MTKYKFMDGFVVVASTPLEFVEKMRQSSFTPSDDAQEFMDQVSDRGSKIGMDIRANSANNFLRDLINNEVVSIVTEETAWN